MSASALQPRKHIYILTGSTGSLGSYILIELLNSPDVEHVYCLNRSADAADRQRKTFEDRRVNLNLRKATFIKANSGEDRFGLSHETYQMLLRDVDIFIHNAWAVDFNQALQTFEDVHIAGTRRCADFSLESRHQARVVFISSIASVGNYLVTHPGESQVPEQILDDHRVPLAWGYGESKHVASLILARAAQKSGVSAIVIRAGQLAGPVGKGAPWSRHEWLPRIILSSKSFGMLPETLGNSDNIDWVPMDLAAKAVVEICGMELQHADALTVAHLVNPRTTS